MNQDDGDSFLRILVRDVSQAIGRRNEADTQAARRDVVRASFAAIEGVVWVFRENVIETAKDTYGLEEDEQIVLSETTFAVSNNGQIFPQQRFIPLLASIRLIARIAERLSEKQVINFSDNNWSALQAAMSVRNRITHPKSREDLRLSEDDVAVNVLALDWLSKNLAHALDTMVATRKQYLGDFKTLLAQLEAGHPETTALYKALRDYDG